MAYVTLEPDGSGTSSMVLTAGSRLGPYHVVGPLGAGGMGEVYRALDTRLSREIAIKILPAAKASDPEAVDRFQREARAIASLNHPHIVSIHSVEEAEGVHFLTMELVDGRPLDAALPPGGFAPDRLLEIGTALADAVAAAHERGVVHRDLKPANVMIDRRGHLKVLDFGMAKMADAADAEVTRLDLTRAGTIIGTVPYMSPEQIEGRPADARSDIFSLGVVLYELATGERPFGGESAASVMASILRDAAPRVDQRRHDLPRDLAQLIARCLEKDPADRIQSARELETALRAIRRDADPRATTDSSIRRADERRLRRESGLWTAVLPFAARSDDPDVVALADGLTEEVTGGLSKFTHLRVVSGESARRAAREAFDARACGAELGTRYVLEGVVRRAGTTVRVSVDLIDTDGGVHLWAERFDRDLSRSDPFAIQDELGARIVATVADSNGVLVRSMASGLRDRPAEALTITQLVLRTFLYIQQVRLDEHARLRDALERALAREPSDADGWAALARLYAHEHMWHANTLPDPIGRQRRAAQRAIELDPTCHVGWEMLAAACYFARDLEGFRGAAERALALNPLDANVVALLGLLFAYSGEWDRGIALVRRAMSLNPQYPGWYHLAIFHAHFRLGQYEEALREVKRVNMPGFRWMHLATAAVCGHLGRHGEAAEALEAVRTFDPSFVIEHARRDWQHWMHDTESVEGLIDGLRKAEAGGA